VTLKWVVDTKDDYGEAMLAVHFAVKGV